MNSASETNTLLPAHYEEQQPAEDPGFKGRLWSKAVYACKCVGNFARLLLGLLLDPRVDKKVKIFAGAVLAYIVSPADFIPELFTGIFGMLDDFVLSAFAVNIILNWVDPEIVRAHWHGEQDLLATVQRVMKNAEVFVPDGVLKKIEVWIGKHAGKALQS